MYVLDADQLKMARILTEIGKLDRAKKVISENFKELNRGIFNTRNTKCDIMSTIYEEGPVNEYDDSGLVIDACFDNQYFEVFGLSRWAFGELTDYYFELLVNEMEEK